MRRIRFLVQKEFIQVFRDKFMVRLIFAVPVVQLLVLANAATYDIKNLNILIIDRDRSPASQSLIDKIEGSNYFRLVGFSYDDQAANGVLDEGKADLTLNMPRGFGRDLAQGQNTRVQVLIDAVDGSKAALAQEYLAAVINEFARERAAFSSRPITMSATGSRMAPTIEIEYRNWYNLEESYKIFMVPGILVSLVTLLAMFLSALNIVREKEMGTIEQINVTTIRKREFIIGKILPFGILSLIVFTVGLVAAKFIFHTPMLGSVGLLFLFAILYIVAALGLGIVISNMSSGQLQAMFTSFFFLIIFILMSGLFTPVDSMPAWAQHLNILNPMAYFIEFIRLLMLKGSNFRQVGHLFLSMGLFAVFANILAVWTYTKRVA